MKEATIQNQIRLAAAQGGSDLWRNNVGVLLDKTGRPVRYGLANENPNINKVIKSSDLIGITPLFVTPEMVGRIVGVFTAVEVKRGDWKFCPNDEHSLAQKNFHDIVKKSGGFAGFAQSVEDYRRIINYETR